MLACILIILVLLFLFALYYGYRLAFFYRDPKAAPTDYVRDDQVEQISQRLDETIAGFEAVPWEDVAITARDGTALTGRYYRAAEGAPLQIQFHGYKGNAIRDFCGVWPVAQKLGHNVLLVDQRCHGNSGGHTITFGIRERLDCLDWVNYACDRFGPVPTVLMGVSMGAATVLMASSLELPNNVKGIVADCPYDAPANIIKKVLGVEMGMPVKLVYPLIRLGGILYGRFDLEAASPLESVPNAKCPILLIHGDDDRFVPYEMSCRIYAAAPETVEFHTVPGSGHAMNSIWDPEQYRAVLLDFLRKTL